MPQGNAEATCDQSAVLPPPADELGGEGALHHLSCRCGSDTGDESVDAQTNSICGLQPRTTLTLEVARGGGAGAAGVLRAVERAGVGSQDPVADGGKWAFAAAGVWAANFSACSWGDRKSVV